jgi:hypothetical protein
MPVWEYILLFSTVFLGGATGFYLQKEKKGWLHIILSFSGAYILGIAVLHLMPWVFGSAEGNHAGLLVLAGFFVQLMLEQLSAGVEHGHIHAPHHLSAGFVFSVMFGLCIHAFVEGIPLSYYEAFHNAEHGHGHSHNHLLYGIILHHIPAAFALVFLLIITKLKKGWIWVCLFSFAAMSPLGAALASTFNIPSKWQVFIIAFVIGSLLHISTVILFEMDSSSHHYISWKKLAAIGSGFGIAVLTI